MIPCQRHLFDIPDDVAYLNCAYMSPLMKPALEAGTVGLARKAHAWDLTPDQFFTGADEFRATAAQLLFCWTGCIAIVPSACYGIAIAASYTWLVGPSSVGLLYVAPKWQNGMPLEENWIQRANAQDFSSLILYTEDYDAGARRFDMGERANFASLPAAVRAMKQLQEWKIAQISETAGALNRHLAEAAADLGFSAPSEPLRAPHYLSLRRKAAIPRELPEMLAREKVFVSVRGSSIRVTPNVYNTVEDGERLIACLRRFAT